MSRVCPLMFTSTADLEDFICRPDKCAWAYNGGCAITALAQRLDAIAPAEDDSEMEDCW